MTLLVVLIRRLLFFFLLGALTTGVSSAQDPSPTLSITPLKQKLIAREWRGKVHKKDADEYASYLLREDVNKLAAIPGNLGVQMFRLDEGDTVEFTVISYWPSIEAIKRYAGESYQKPHHLPKDPEYLIELPQVVRHYEVIVDSRQGGR
jgi:heme-degrading monooxygenase HmoA